MNKDKSDFIAAETAVTLAGLFRERVKRSPNKVAYRQFDQDTGQWCDSTWQEMATEVARWQDALAREGLQQGERVAVLLRNCKEWVTFDQAALGCGLVVVPLYTDDRPESAAYILNHCGAKVLLLQGEEQWQGLLTVHDQLGDLTRILTLEPVTVPEGETRVSTVADWLPETGGELHSDDGDSSELATIVYTSGTTGRPKGVMLSHWNILFDSDSALEIVQMYADDLLISFLPLSHTFERTVGYYIPMMVGANIAYARSISELGEDLQTIKPTLMISVPRIYERVYNKIQAGLAEKSPLATKLFNLAVDTGWKRFLHRQGRGSWHPVFLLWPLLNKLVAGKIMAKLGGNMHMAASGGAPLPMPIARVFIGLGLNLIQGYGLTETSPILTANPEKDNEPGSVGIPLRGIELRVADDDELLARGPVIMLGYWNNQEATDAVIDAEGWFHTGDKARIENNHVYITGRLKEIIVMANGEKVPPADMEMAIALDTLFEQVMIIGDNRPFLTAMIVLNEEQWAIHAKNLELDSSDPDAPAAERFEKLVCEKITMQLSEFPGYAIIRQVTCVLEPWTIENELITPTLKLKRNRIMERFETDIEKMYEGH
ncbi:MAG: long-chain fatty acid--CoA ligase [Gammaproteobacteria bacterium]|nr:long-chain fatty acid--CoA ligase [Gammaproteobacteria bacterium]MDH3987062.1 long-chain fatty acid--CoA ligase [Gammaproteobacteria bacterium]